MIKKTNDDLKKRPGEEPIDIVLRELGLTLKETKKPKVKHKPEPLPDIFEGEH
jgi:hypothetical protein